MTSQNQLNNRADALAERIEFGAKKLAEFAEKLSNEEWQTFVDGDGRSVGVVIHHVASSYPIEVELAQTLASGKPISDVTKDVVDELNDEYDSHEIPVQWIRKSGERDYHVSARVELDALEELGLDLPDGQYASLAGFLLDKAQDIPAVGTVIEFQDISFTIERATPQAIQEVRIQW